MKTLLFTFFVLFLGSAQAETIRIEGQVLDLSGNGVEAAVLLNHKGKEVGVTDVNGKFSDIPVKAGTRFGVSKPGFDLKWIALEDGKVRYDVVLDVEIQELETVVITRKNSEEALDLKNVNIIHYQPLDGSILTLKRKKRTYYLGMDSLRREGVSYALNIKRPRELYFDCLQHAYILSEDSAYQFVMLDSGLVLMPPMTIQSFDQYIRPCVAKFEDRLVMEEFRSYNKEYDLVMYDDEEPKTIYHRMDILGYQAAYEASVNVGQTVDPNDGDTLTDPVYLRRQERRDVYGRHDTGPDFQRRLGEQNREVMEQNQLAMQTFNNPDSVGVITTQRASQPFGSSDAWRSGGDWAEGMAAFMMFTQPLDVRSFQVGSFVATVDFDSNKVHIMDHYGFPITTSTFDIPSDVKNVLQDRASSALYLYTRDHGNHKVYEIDPFTGRTVYVKNFGGLPHAEQAIIYDGYLYYKLLERDFYGVNRVKLPNSEFYAED